MAGRIIPLLGLLILGLGSAQSALAQQPDGAALFMRYCAACHGSDGRGEGPVAAALWVMVPDLTRISIRAGGRFPEAQVRRIVDGQSVPMAHGTRIMPVWGEEFYLAEGADAAARQEAQRRISALVDYLRTIQAAGGGGGE